MITKKIIPIKNIGSYMSTDEQGYLINPTSLEKIPPQYQIVLDEIITIYQNKFGTTLQNVYIRGSVPRGTAVEYLSDIDTFAYVDLDKENIDYQWIHSAEKDILKKYPFVKGVEFKVSPLRDSQYDSVILNQSLCMYGEPIQVPRLKIDRNLAIHIPHFETRIKKFNNFLTQEKTPEEMQSYCTWQMKGMLRVGSEITLERSKKYTRDLYKCYEVFSEYYPEKEESMREVLYLALNPVGSKEKLTEVMNDFGSWLLDESKRVYKLPH